MTRVEELEREVRELTPAELASFREWFAEFDAAAWDQEIAADADAGKLDRIANTALADHAAGRSRKP